MAQTLKWSAVLGAPQVDKKAMTKLSSRLKKVLEHPEQAQLELDPNGCINVLGLGGKFRVDKLAPILGLEPDTSVADTMKRFRKALNKHAPVRDPLPSPPPLSALPKTLVLRFVSASSQRRCVAAFLLTARLSC